MGKEEALRQVLEQTEGLIEGQRNWVCPVARPPFFFFFFFVWLGTPSWLLVMGDAAVLPAGSRPLVLPTRGVV